MPRPLAVLFIFLAFFLALPLACAQQPAVVFVDLSGEIDQSTVLVFADALEFAKERGAQALVVILDTPGGGLQQTFDIEAMIRASTIPVVGYVSPSGATAWSAGTFILMSCHVAAMANHTLIGSCQPVEIGVEGTRLINDSKTINALVSWLQERALMYGRNETLAREFITQNRNVNASQALSLGAIEVVADDRDLLLEHLNNRTVALGNGTVTLHTSEAPQVAFEPSLFQDLYSFITNPILSSLLLMLGIFSLIVGLSSPGFGAEVFGGIAIVLGLVGLGFDVSVVSIIFIILGVVLLLVEIFVTPGFTVVGVGGLICLIIGGIFLIPSYPTREWLISSDYMNTALLILLVVILLFAVFFGFLLYKVLQVRRKRPAVGMFQGETATTLDAISPDKPGYVRYKGEYWLARSDVAIAPNTKVTILRKEETLLHVEPLESPKN